MTLTMYVAPVPPRPRIRSTIPVLVTGSHLFPFGEVAAAPATNVGACDQST
jgi:hypothetical protein